MHLTVTRQFNARYRKRVLIGHLEFSLKNQCVVPAFADRMQLAIYSTKTGSSPKHIFHKYVISCTCSKSNSDGSVLKQNHQN